MGVKINIKGQFPNEGPFVIMSNHGSFIDVFVVPPSIQGKYTAIVASKKGASVDEVAIKNIELTVADLKSKSEIIKNALEKGKIGIVSAYYYLDSGKVDFF